MSIKRITTESSSEDINKFISLVGSGDNSPKGATVNRLQQIARRKPIAGMFFMYESLEADISFAVKYNNHIDAWRIFLIGFDKRSGTNKQIIRQFISMIIDFMDNRNVDTVYFMFDETTPTALTRVFRDLIKQEWEKDDGDIVVSGRRVIVQRLVREYPMTFFDFFDVNFDDDYNSGYGYGYGYGGIFGQKKVQRVIITR